MTSLTTSNPLTTSFTRISTYSLMLITNFSSILSSSNESSITDLNTSLSFSTPPLSITTFLTVSAPVLILTFPSWEIQFLPLITDFEFLSSTVGRTEEFITSSASTLIPLKSTTVTEFLSSSPSLSLLTTIIVFPKSTKLPSTLITEILTTPLKSLIIKKLFSETILILSTERSISSIPGLALTTNTTSAFSSDIIARTLEFLSSSSNISIIVTDRELLDILSSSSAIIHSFTNVFSLSSTMLALTETATEFPKLSQNISEITTEHKTTLKSTLIEKSSSHLFTTLPPTTGIRSTSTLSEVHLKSSTKSKIVARFPLPLLTSASRSTTTRTRTIEKIKTTDNIPKMLYNSDVFEPDFDINFVSEKMNFTNAARYCHIRHTRFLYIRSAQEENYVMDLAKTKSHYFDRCKGDAMIGYRTVMSEEWRSESGSPIMGGELSSIWYVDPATSREKLRGECAALSYEFGYLLRTFPCETDDHWACFLCETNSNRSSAFHMSLPHLDIGSYADTCSDHRDVCYRFFSQRVQSAQEANKLCRLQFRQGRLAVISNRAYYDTVLKMFQRRNVGNLCPNIYVGNKLNSAYETIREERMPYISVNIDRSKVWTNDHCLAISQPKGYKLAPVHCSRKMCFLCRLPGARDPPELDYPEHKPRYFYID